MTYEQYKEYFFENAEEVDEEEFIELEVKGIDNEKDKETEFSIKWHNLHNPSEKGEIRNINTSSIWALMSCSWVIEEDSEEESE